MTDLSLWLKDPHRKPLFLRGARQVGKSTLVRLFCEQEKLELIEVNLEIARLKSTSFDNFELQSLPNEIQFKKRRESQRIPSSFLMKFKSRQSY